MDSYTLKQLLQATEGHAELPDRALKLASMTKENAFGSYDQSQLLSNMASCLIRFLPKNQTIPAPIQISLIKKLYGKSCPLQFYPLSWVEIKPESSQFIAALYYLAQTSTYDLDVLMKPMLQKVIAEIAFAQGKHWDALRSALESVDGLKLNYQLLDSVPDLLANLHEHFKQEHDAVYLQQYGGVERLVAVGADLNAVCKSVLQSIAGTKLTPPELLIAHQFLLDANQELVASGKIAVEEAKERHGRMMLATSRAMARKPSDPNDCYRTILISLAPLIGSRHGSELIPLLTQSLTIQEITQLIENPLLVIEPAKFKKHLNKHVGAEKRYDLVVALGVQELFTTSEMNKFKGEKLESALGF
jgi:hypothetical protein